MELFSVSSEVILNALSKLVSAPSDVENGKSEMKTDKLQTIFEYNIDQMLQVLPKSSAILNDKDCCIVNDDTYWKYVWYNIKLLWLLTDSISADLKHFSSQNPAPQAMSPDTLSFTSQQTITKSIQFVVGCGICPLLCHGVGLPLDRRSGYSGIISEAVSKLSDIDRSTGDGRLLTCVDTLMHCCTVSTLSALIIPRYLNDLLAASIQLFCLPNSTLNTEEKTVCETMLQHLSENVNRAVVIKEVIILQNGPPPTRNSSGKLCIKKVPVWLKQTCSGLLRKFIMMPSGVLTVFRALVPEIEDASVITEQKQSFVSLDWKRNEATARIIVDCPLDDVNVKCYYRNIGSQILAMLREDSSGLYRPLLISALSLMRSRQPVLTDELIAQEVVPALLMCVQRENVSGVEQSANGTVFVSGPAIESCILDIHKIFILECESHFDFISSLEPVVHVLFCLYCQTLDGISFMKSQVQEIIIWIFTHMNLSKALLYMKQLMCCRDKGDLAQETSGSCGLAEERLLRMRQDLKFNTSGDGGLEVVLCNEVCVEEEVDMMDKAVEAVIEILTQVKRQDDLVTQFFLHCLKELTTLVSGDVKNLASAQVRHQSTHIEVSHVRSAADIQLKYNMTLFALLGAMCERLGYQCLKNSQHIVEFVKATLERALRILENTDDAEFSSLETETVSMSIGLMTAIIIDENYKSSLDWKHCEQLLPLLQILSKKHYDSEIRDMVMSLQVAIATHGFVTMDNISADFIETIESSDKKLSKTNETKSSTSSHLFDLKLDNNIDSKTVAVDKPLICMKSKGQAEAANTSHRLIEEISSTDFTDHVASDSVESGNISIVSQSSLSQSLSQDAKHSVASNLSHNTRAVSNDCKPTVTCESSLSHEQTNQDCNSSAYNSAMREVRDPLLPVQGHGLIMLRRLIEQNDSETINHINEVISICHDSLSDSDSYIYLAAVQTLVALGEKRPDVILDVVIKEYVEGRQAELSMKLGEVLVKIVTALGELVPHHRDRLLNAVLTVIRTSNDELVRASAVSNLAQICERLHFSIGNCVSEIFLCVHNLLKYESHIQVRRSAAMFITLLLKGLSSDTFKILNSTLLELYKLLKHTVIVDKDEIVQLHVQLALEQLDIIVKDFLFPKPSFTKRIHVIDPFDTA